MEDTISLIQMIFDTIARYIKLIFGEILKKEETDEE